MINKKYSKILQKIMAMSFIFIAGFLFFYFFLQFWIHDKLTKAYTKKIIIDVRAGKDCAGGAQGLGNQFFMFAIGYSYAKKFGIPEILMDNLSACDDTRASFQDLHKRCYALDKFGINYPIMYNLDKLTEEDRQNTFSIKKYKDLTAINRISYFKAKNKPHNIRITSIFEKEMSKHFQAYSEELKNIISYKEELSTEAKMMLASIKNTNSVSLHIRRGDFVTLGRNISLNYQVKAAYLIASKVFNPHFFIFTDDVAYVKKYFADKANFKILDHKNKTRVDAVYKLLNRATYVSEKVNHSLEEFHLMSNCKNNIVPNSTFSWWAAFLNKNPNKIVLVSQPAIPKNAPGPPENENWIEIY